MSIANPIKPITLWAMVWLLAGLSACSNEYRVQITNHRASAVELLIEQYRGEPPGSSPPRAYRPELRLRSERLRLAPGETSPMKFIDAAGGFWLRWQVLGAADAAYTTLDLLRQPATIDIN